MTEVETDKSSYKNVLCGYILETKDMLLPNELYTKWADKYLAGIVSVSHTKSIRNEYRIFGNYRMSLPHQEGYAKYHLIREIAWCTLDMAYLLQIGDGFRYKFGHYWANFRAGFSETCIPFVKWEDAVDRGMVRIEFYLVHVKRGLTDIPEFSFREAWEKKRSDNTYTILGGVEGGKGDE